MSVFRKSVVAILMVGAAYVIYRVLAAGVAVTGSGGLGAVSAGFSEALIEVVLLVVPTVIALYARSWWRRRRSRSRGLS